MIKMQIEMDKRKINKEKRYDAAKIDKAIKSFLSDKLGFKADDKGFYYGRGDGKDFSYFGIVFNTLRKKPWFIENVKTWLYYNSDASDDPNDFVIEDFKAASLGQPKMSI